MFEIGDGGSGADHEAIFAEPTGQNGLIGSHQHVVAPRAPGLFQGDTVFTARKSVAA